MVANKTTRKLARKLNRPPAATRNAPTGPWAVGTVTAVSLSTNSLTVELQGDTTAIPGISFLDSYMPVVGDNVQLVRIKNHYWVIGSVAGSYETIVGPGTTPNISSSGGANRTNTVPFLYVDHAAVSTTTGSGWSYTSSGKTFNGIGLCMVAPGAGSNSLFSLTQNQPTISGGNFSVSGAAFVPNSGQPFLVAGIGSSLSIQLSVLAVGW